MMFHIPSEGPVPGIVERLPRDLLEMVDRYEKEGQSCIATKINIVHHNIIVLDVTVYSSPLPGPSIAFTSLNLWQEGDCYYVADMQDGKVSGFEIYPVQDNIKTPADFIGHILHDLFYGW